MSKRIKPVQYSLKHCRVAHGRVYQVEIHDGDSWRPHGELVVTRDRVVHRGKRLRNVDYHGAHHALFLAGKADDATFRARLDLTECGTAFVGTMSTGGGAPKAVRGIDLEVVYHTEQRPKGDTDYQPWVDFTIRSAWVGNELTITYLLGAEDVSDRVRVTNVDRAKGETTLEMVAGTSFPFRNDTFVLVLASGNHSFTGTYTDTEGCSYDWRGDTSPAPAVTEAAAARDTRTAGRDDDVRATMSLQELDNVSSIQVLLDDRGKEYVVDFAQTTCGEYFNKCLANALDKTWVDGIYGGPYALDKDVAGVFLESNKFFTDNAVLGTGQMLYGNVGRMPQYKPLVDRMNKGAMDTAWDAMGKNTTIAPEHQKASDALYIYAYRDSVSGIRPYLADNPEKWAKDYFDWLNDSANLLTWQIQLASSQFKNVDKRMYEWYVKLQVLAPDKDYGKQFMSTAYAALLNVNYSKARWSADIQPLLEAVIRNARDGKIDPNIMDQLQQQAAKENQELLKELLTTPELAAQLADAIAAVMDAIALRKTMMEVVREPSTYWLIGEHLEGTPLFERWSDLTKKGKAFGVLSTLAYGASAAFLIYNLVKDAENPQTPARVIGEVNLGILALAAMVKGVEKLMSIGVGRALQNFARYELNGLQTFAKNIAAWFVEGGKVVPTGPLGKAFVTVFGENATEFMTRRMGPLMAVFGLVLASFSLWESIESGIVRNIVFEALNSFAALATVIALGFELASFAWAGPLGIGLAVVGVLIAAVQFIWNLIDPPAPPPDPITEFVNGPMVRKGFAKAA